MIVYVFEQMPINPPYKKSLAVGNIRMAYCEAGDPEKRAVLFLHGYPTHSFLWRKVMAGLKDSYYCLAPDLMGLGDTEAPADKDLSPPSQARMIGKFLRTMGIWNTALVGHDHGGGIAQILATGSPVGVSHLILVDSVGYDAWPVPRVRARAWIARRFPRLSSSPLLMETFWRSRIGLPQAVLNPSLMTPEVLEEYIRPITASDERRESFRRYLLACDSGATIAASERLKNLHVPALIVWGSHDRFLPISLGERLARDIPACRGLEIVPDAGHLLPEEKPRVLASLIDEFLHT